MKILFVCSECMPYVKTGGLGDATAGLAKALGELGHEVRVLMPLYSEIPREKYKIKYLASSCIHMGDGEEQWIGLYEGSLSLKVRIWFMECDRFFARPGIYSYNNEDYPDNAYRYALLSKAALQIAKDQIFIPEVMHVHDWPAALVPLFLKTWDRILSPLSSTASVLTIHNIGYQGVYTADVLKFLGVGLEYYHSGCLEAHGRINMLKAGIAMADAITTVSPTHADEICDPIGGMGMAPYISSRKGDLFGILNGVDYDHWDPETDEHIPFNYSVRDTSGKVGCKKELQRYFGLPEGKEIPVVGIVTRLVAQKGISLMQEALGSVVDEMDLQLVMLGSGLHETEAFFHRLKQRFPDKVGIHIGFSGPLSHLIEAGSDFFLMPSIYEPCGLNQIYSLKYGTVPIVRSTGGLEDTVVDWKNNNGTGIKFNDISADSMKEALCRAMQLWYDYPKEYLAIRKRGMKQDFCWKESAKKYEVVYTHAIERRLNLLPEAVKEDVHEKGTMSKVKNNLSKSKGAAGRLQRVNGNFMLQAIRGTSKGKS
ncbi:MAG: glycogen synthase GlgA [Verrucomicrobiota bacterium]